MPDELIEIQPEPQKAIRFRFHPLVRFSMLLMGLVAAGYSLYFIAFLIPQTANYTIFFKIISVVVLYVSLSTTYTHLTSLNTVIIRDGQLELHFLIRRNIIVPWHNLLSMDIYKVITHYWKINYLDNKGIKRTFKTSLAFPGIMKILITIQDRKPDVELNNLLEQVLLYRRKTTSL